MNDSENTSERDDSPSAASRSPQPQVPQFTHDLQVLREREAAQIATRRERVDLNPDEPSTCGLALSGGGIRSACFNLGVLQALHRTGLFRFVDYLSTVSGGGYLGAKLATHACEFKSSPQTDFPFAEADSGHRQSRRVLRLTYGGYYLLRPLSLMNKYLIGVLFNNLAVLTALVALCASIAFLWRCLDYPWLRDRLALLSLGSDLVTPFIPFFLLAACWFVAWILSYFQRQAEAPGHVARFLFVLMFAALLIGVAILIGNGDIALPTSIGSWIGDSMVSVSPQVWGTFIVLVLLAALPVLRPQRLLRSGTRPQHAWEKWIFNTTSIALLCGLPLCLIGWFARENISGYSTSANRGFHRAEVLSWPALTSLVLHGDDELVSTQSAEDSSPLAAMFRALALQNPASPPRAFAALRSEKGSSESKALQAGLKGPDQFPQHARRIRSLNSEKWDVLLKSLEVDKTFVQADSSIDQPDSPFVRALVDISETPEMPWTTAERETATRIIQQFNAALQQTEPSDGDGIPYWTLDMEGYTFNNLPEVIQQRPMTFLQYLAIRIIKASRDVDVARRKLDNLDRSAAWKAGDYHISQWESLRFDDYFKRCLSIIGWSCGLEGTAVAEYMEKRERFLRLQEQFVIVFNLCVLPTTELTENLESYKAVVKARSPEDWEKLRDLLFAANVAGASDVHEQNLAGINRDLLTVVFPDVFRPVTDYQRRVVIYADQLDRVVLMVVALVSFVLIGMWVDVNATSMHRYYRVQLSKAFLDEYPRATRHSLSEIAPQNYGYPYPLFCASVSMFRRQLLSPPRDDMPDTDKQDFDPRWVDTFVMSPEFCGSCNTGFVPTTRLEQHLVGFNTLTIGEVMALSGAAVSPSQNPNWLIAFMMFALNLRLGQWLPRPGGPKPRTRPRFITILSSLFRPADERKYCFVSDGGHSENLGLVELLKRRCRLIIVSDAGQDPLHEFSDLSRAMRTARIHGGVRIVALADEDTGDGVDAGAELSLAPLRLRRSDSRRDQTGKQEQAAPELKLCDQHFIAARILYPARDDQEASEGLLIYLKPSITGDESLDVLQYRDEQRHFPHEPTSDQLYSPEQIEAYRNLGYHIATELCRRLLPDVQDESLWSDARAGESAQSLAEQMQNTYESWRAEQQSAAQDAGGKKPAAASRPRQRKTTTK